MESGTVGSLPRVLVRGETHGRVRRSGRLSSRNSERLRCTYGQEKRMERGGRASREGEQIKRPPPIHLRPHLSSSFSPAATSNHSTFLFCYPARFSLSLGFSVLGHLVRLQFLLRRECGKVLFSTPIPTKVAERASGS